MSRPRRISGSIGTTVLVTGIVAAAVPASAGAASHRTTSASASTITLDASFRKALRADRITLKAGKPATLRGAKLRLPVTRSATAKGTTTLIHGGSLTLRRGSRSSAATSWRTVVRTKTATVSALIARKRVSILTIRGGTFKADRKTGRVTVSGGRVKLTATGAKALRSRLKGSRLKARTVGRVATSAVAKPDRPATTTPTTPAPTTPAVPTAPTTPQAPAVPSTPAPPTDPCASTVTAATAGATWAVKSSFLSYVQGGIAKGRVETCAGAAAERGVDGKVVTAHFSATGTAGYQPDTGEVSVAVGGSIHFTGHDSGKGPLLDVAFENLRVRSRTGSAGELVADVSSRPFEGMDPGADPPPAETTPDVVLATVDLGGTYTEDDDGVRTYTDDAPVLTEDGSAAFGGFYAAGTALAPLSFTAWPASLDWTQVNVFNSSAAANTDRTWLGYTTNPTPFSGAQGSFTPSDGASGPTLTTSSARGPEATHVTRFAVTSSTLSAATRTGVVQLRGLATFESPGPAPISGHDFTITVKDPRIVFDGSNVAELYATGTTTDPSTSARSAYDQSKPVFSLAVGAIDGNDNGTATISDLAPSIVAAGYAFPASYAAGAGPERTPNTFGSFALTVPTGD